MCARWRESFDAFLADVGPRPAGQRGKRAAYSIDRIDNERGYECGKCEDCHSRGTVIPNCQWSTWEEQNSNQRKTRVVTIAGESRPLQEWRRALDITDNVFYGRLRLGWSEVDALATPVRPKLPNGHGRRRSSRQPRAAR
jgi:hypothetical protein